MISSLPQFDEIYVISDIHMGGTKPEFQIFHQGTRLGRLIDHLSKVRNKNKVALVLNGDVIDSLAEENDGYIAMENAEAMMERIANDSSFKPVWKALAKFVGTPGRHLIIALGNHDIELMLPFVEYWIRKNIAGDDAAAQGRIIFATRGVGYSCNVGDARVLCTHGNEVDDWNVVDQDSLCELAGALNAGRRYKDWKPNAGTRLVVDVMNNIKRDYPFVDLLKPETKAVVPILLALDPGRVKDAIGAVPKVAKDLFWGYLERKGILSVDSLEQTTDTAAGDVALDNLLGANFKEGIKLSPTVSEDADDLLLAVEEDYAAGIQPLDNAGAESTAETLGTFGYIYDRIRGVPKDDALRRALLDWLEKDDTYELTTKDETFERITKQVGSSVDFIVTGHTHLERAIPLDGGKRFYYNCGTWARLLRLSNTVLKDKKEFKKVFKVLKSGTMSGLDNTQVKKAGGGTEGLILNRSTLVRISAQDNVTTGELFHVEDGADGKITLTAIPGTQYTRR